MRASHAALLLAPGTSTRHVVCTLRCKGRSQSSPAWCLGSKHTRKRRQRPQVGREQVREPRQSERERERREPPLHEHTVIEKSCYSLVADLRREVSTCVLAHRLPRCTRHNPSDCHAAARPSHGTQHAARARCGLGRKKPRLNGAALAGSQLPLGVALGPLGGRGVVRVAVGEVLLRDAAHQRVVCALQCKCKPTMTSKRTAAPHHPRSAFWQARPSRSGVPAPHHTIQNSLGLQSVSSEQMESRTLDTVSAGLHWSLRMSRQMAPLLLMLQW